MSNLCSNFCAPEDELFLLQLMLLANVSFHDEGFFCL
jgi:hypothetical protein